MKSNESGSSLYVAFYPTYEEVRAALRVWAGVTPSQITSMRNAIAKLRGTPQDPVDWTKPDHWIKARLSGEPRKLALSTWEGSKKCLNPRYALRPWSLVTQAGLLAAGPDGRLARTKTGEAFLREAFGAAEQAVDRAQGIDTVLALVGRCSFSSVNPLSGAPG